MSKPTDQKKRKKVNKRTDLGLVSLALNYVEAKSKLGDAYDRLASIYELAEEIDKKYNGEGYIPLPWVARMTKNIIRLCRGKK